LVSPELEEPLDDEPDPVVLVVPDAVEGLALTLTTDHVPTSLNPCPFVWPALVSSANVYRGMPLYVTWTEPFGRFTVLSVATLPDGVPSPDAVSGCQTPTHAAVVQMKWVPVSPLRAYSVIPCESTRIVPRGLEAVRTSPVWAPLPADVEVAGDAVEPLVLLEELLPHADSNTVASRVLARMDALRMIAPICPAAPSRPACT
jgi:hypothetical protein